MSRKNCGIVILGGGPAGCAAALGAIKAGYNDITIIERELCNRHRIGEILLTQTVLEYQHLGIAEEVAAYADEYQWNRKYAATYVHGNDRTPWKVQNNNPIHEDKGSEERNIPACFINNENKLWFTHMVRRHEYDFSLREIVKKRGVKIIEGKIKDLKILGDGNNTHITKITVDCEPGTQIEIFPQLTIDCTGQNAIVANKLKARHSVGDWGLKAKYSYFKNIDFNNALKHGFLKEGANILSYEDGWVWIANLGKNMTSIGVVSKDWENPNFFQKISKLPEYKIFGIDKAEVIDCYGNKAKEDHHYVHHDYRYKSSIMHGKNWVTAGDSAVFLDPLLSQGVTLAMHYGNRAGDICANILAGNLDSEHYKFYEKNYINEIQILNNVVSLWYKKEFSFEQHWEKVAAKISNAFGRDIGNDVESFRWLSNLENIHLIKGKDQSDLLAYLANLAETSDIQNFEQNGLLTF